MKKTTLLIAAMKVIKYYRKISEGPSTYYLIVHGEGPEFIKKVMDKPLIYIGKLI